MTNQERANYYARRFAIAIDPWMKTKSRERMHFYQGRADREREYGHERELIEETKRLIPGAKYSTALILVRRCERLTKIVEATNASK